MIDKVVWAVSGSSAIVFSNSEDIEVELTKEECLTGGMSDKEYSIQKALGSLPIKSLPILREIYGSYDDDDIFISPHKFIKEDK